MRPAGPALRALGSRQQGAGEDEAVSRPVVIPTRRRIDRRFPSLALTVTSDQPWVEVLLAIDPADFDPARAPARTAASFYASRTTGGLTPTVGRRARYVVPAAVVERLAASGSSLWYLAIAYPDATGVGGVASAESGASGAVVVDPSLRPAGSASTLRRTLGLTRALSTPGPDDRRAGEDAADLGAAQPAVASGQAWRQAAHGLADDDRRQGQDGSDVPPTAVAGPADIDAARLPTGPAAGSAPAPAAAPAAPAAPTAPTTEPVQRQEPPVESPALSMSDYDDGWDRLDTAQVPALSAVPALSDEYPDIDWDGIEVPDRYGTVPGYESLEGPATIAPSATDPRPALTLPTVDLPAETQRHIIERTLGGDDAAYAAVNADGPFRGRHGPGHKAYQRFHTGLAYGVAEFSQDSGALGQVLRLMDDREPNTFTAVFGAAAQQLLDTTSAPGPSGEHVDGGRGPRVQPVDGADLWEEPWLSRFRAAGAVPAFRAAQNQLAAELYLAPMLTVAAGFGLTDERALCLVLDRAVALGEQGAKRWIADTVGPVRTPAQRHDALAALGFTSIEGFQAAVPGLLTDGEFGPVTHATLAAALRSLGGASPLPVLDTGQAVDAMARRAQGEDGTARLLRLAGAPEPTATPIGG